MYRKSSIKPPGGLFISSPFETEGLFNLEKTTVSVLTKDLKYQVEKLKNKKVGGHAAEDQNQYRASSWWTKHPGSVYTKFYIRDCGSLSFISKE